MRSPVASMAVAAILVVVLGTAVYVGVQQAVKIVIRHDSEQTALSWANYFTDAIPNIDNLVKGMPLTEKQIEAIKAAEKFGKVFRFKLFGLDGNLRFVSDELRYGEESTAGKHENKVLGVISSGNSRIELKNGVGVPDRPDVYVEAYIPHLNTGQNTIGAIEVYVDQSATVHYLNRIFTILSIVLALLVSLAFGAPLLAYIAKNFQEQRARKRVEYLAHHDVLTETLNRQSFVETIKQLMRKNSDDFKYAALMKIDIDNFRAINEMHGHNVGDKYLENLVTSICSNIGDDDLVARFGGDEFAVFFPNTTERKLSDFANAICTAANNSIFIEGATVAGNVSIGIKLANNEIIDLDYMITRADLALYKSKLDGGNQHNFYSVELEIQAVKSRKILSALNHGLERELFSLDFQPLIASASGQCVGFEALLRLRTIDGEKISPEQFIPMAESNGTIIAIGGWVLEEAIKTASTWPADKFVAINLSTLQFENDELVSQVSHLIKKYKISPSQIELEVTESLVLSDSVSISRQIRELKALGVTIAIDDFGTGYSSLNYLWNFEFDKIKIDKSFIDALGSGDGRAEEIISSVISLGHNLNMKITAEGVEKASQVKYLAQLKCDIFQGFYFAKPLKIDELPQFLLSDFHSSRIAEEEDKRLNIAN